MNSIEFAINMELESKRFYMQQAENSEERGLTSIFHTLAEEESIHARILKSKAETLPFGLIDTYAEIKNIFVEIGSYKNITKLIPNAFDVYSMALENEKKSLEIYKNMLKEAIDEKEKKIFEYLIEQEDSHCKVMGQLVELTNHPNEWVESAEFGIRKEY